MAHDSRTRRETDVLVGASHSIIEITHELTEKLRVNLLELQVSQFQRQLIIGKIRDTMASIDAAVGRSPVRSRAQPARVVAKPAISVAVVGKAPTIH